MDRDSIIARAAEALLPLVTKDRVAGYFRHWFPTGVGLAGYEIDGAGTAVIAFAVANIFTTVLSALSKPRVRRDERVRLLRDIASGRERAGGEG